MEFVSSTCVYEGQLASILWLGGDCGTKEKNNRYKALGPSVCSVT